MTMRLLRYDAAKSAPPKWSVELDRCHHGHWRGVHARRGMRCYTWIWRMCK